jgi:predicted dinucleotide-binding enzyme
MQVTIIGSGNMAKGIAARAQAGGHSVEFHVRDTAKDADLAKDGVTIVTVGSEVAGEVVILAVPYGAMKDLTTTYGNKLDEKIVVDITNPVDFQTFQLIPKPGTSGAEEVAQIFPASKVVKAFNTVFAGTLQTGKAGGLPLDVFIAVMTRLPRPPWPTLSGTVVCARLMLARLQMPGIWKVFSCYIWPRRISSVVAG